MSYLKDARGALDDDIIDYITFIRKTFSLRDAMTKAAVLPKRLELLENNQLQYEMEQSFRRSVCSIRIQKIKIQVWDNTWHNTKTLVYMWHLRHRNLS